MARKQTSGHVRTSNKGGTFGGGDLIDMNLRWKVTPTAMAESYAGWWRYTEQRIATAIMVAGEGAVAYARIAHPWRNRTGDAERGLGSSVTQNGDTFTLTVYHSVDYGRYLEQRWGGRWGVLPATMDVALPAAMQAVQDALR